MTKIYSDILKAKIENRKLLAILLDPDKVDIDNASILIDKINLSPATHIFVGGSLVLSNKIDDLILKLKQDCELPIILFPGNPSQISSFADGILFLSLISGRNPDYLIEHHVNAIPILKQTNLEVIATGYILIESGNDTAVSRVSQTKPLARNNAEYILQTAQAGEMLGNKLIYVESGSGADYTVPQKVVTLVSKNIGVPVIVGGGITDLRIIQKMYDAGADLVVIGTAFENDVNFFNR